jgi:predicted nucleic acid-binding protein
MQRERKKYHNTYYEKNKNKCREYYQENREKILERSKRHYKENIELKKLYNQNYYEDNRDHLLVKQKVQNLVYFFKNRSRMLEFFKVYNSQHTGIDALNKTFEYTPDKKIDVCFD